MQNNFTVTEISDAEEFEKLCEEWNELVEHDDHATVFQLWEFQYHTWKIFADVITPCLVLVRNANGQLVGCAPLGVKRSKIGPLSASTLEFVAERFSDYCNFIIHREFEKDVLFELSQWLKSNLKRWDMMYLRSLRGDSWVISKIDTFRDAGLPLTVSETSVAPCMRLDNEWASYEDAMSKKRAKSLRYMVRKLFRDYGGEYKVIKNSEDLVKPMKQFMDLHQKRMHQKNQRGHFGEDNVRSEFIALIQKLAKKGYASVHTIGSDKEVIAAICTLNYHGSVCFYQGGFDTDYTDLSPGTVMQCLRINDAIEDGAVEYDFLDGDEPYKKRWANERRPIYQVEVRTGSWKRYPFNWLASLRKKLAESEKLRALYLKIK